LQTHRSASRRPVPSSAGRRKPPQAWNHGSSSRALGASAGRRWLGRWEKAGEKVGRVSALLLQLPFHTYLRTICRDLPPGGRSGRPLELASRTTCSARGYGFLARSVFLVSTSTKWLRSTRLVTRTTESNMRASVRVENPCAQRKRELRSPFSWGGNNDRSFLGWIRVRAFMMGPERW
jgi:hypothetical protein